METLQHSADLDRALRVQPSLNPQSTLNAKTNETAQHSCGRLGAARAAQPESAVGPQRKI
jgi:hypothetical protein